jgi:hypothetical protein
MSLNALMREIQVGLGKGKQPDIATANLAAACWQLNKLNADMVNPKFITEDNAADYGKGHEFATALFRSHVEVGPFRMEKYLSSEIMAWAAAFGLGNVVKSGAGPYTYTCTPLVKATAGLELPYFTFVEQIRPASGTILDRAYVGCSLNSFEVAVQTGPGRGNSKITMEMIGSGKITEPSTITLPAATAENLLPAASLALTIIGVDYISLKDIVSLNWGWNNSISRDTAFYPGSGTQNGYAIGGRLESGDRVPSLRFVVRVQAASAEYAKLKDLTTGTAVITQTFDANNTYTATFYQVGFRSVDMGETNGIVTVSVECSPQYNSSNGVLTIAAKCAVDGICQ